MIVADSSALVSLALGRASSDDPSIVSLHLADAEVGHVFRRLVLRGDMKAPDAWAGLVDALSMVAQRFDHVSLIRRAWQLRNVLSFYDALFVALAELLDVTLMTADTRLAGVNGITCPIQPI